MKEPDFEWDVTRDGQTVVIDVMWAETVTDADVDAVVAATEQLLRHDEVKFIQFNGPVMEDRPPRALAATIQALYALARRRRKPLLIGPI